MKRPAMWAAVLGVVLVGAARADIPAPPSLAERVVMSEAVVVGKVTGFGDRLVNAAAPFGGGKADYQIAIVQVSDVLLGAKEAKEVKVGFIPPPPGPRLSRPVANLTLDEEAILFLVPHPDEPFFVTPEYYRIIARPAKPDVSYENVLGEVKRCTKLLADPDAGLKSKDAGDRFLTAALVVLRSRTRPRFADASREKTEELNAEQSQRILTVLADADWGTKPAGPEMPDARRVFLALDLTGNDGWAPPADLAALPDAAKKWLKDHADKYCIRRFVVEKDSK
jgi:hypothetical protein